MVSRRHRFLDLVRTVRPKDRDVGHLKVAPTYGSYISA
jgi:hypothetical protein